MCVHSAVLKDFFSPSHHSWLLFTTNAFLINCKMCANILADKQVDLMQCMLSISTTHKRLKFTVSWTDLTWVKYVKYNSIKDWIKVIPLSLWFVGLIWMVYIHLKRGVKESLNYYLLPKLYVKLWLCPSVNLIYMHSFPQSRLLYLSPWKNACCSGCMPDHHENGRCISRSCILNVFVFVFSYCHSCYYIRIVIAKQQSPDSGVKFCKALQTVHMA